MPKGELGTLIGYDDELQSNKILTNGGKILETKNVRFLDYLKSKDDDSGNEFEFSFMDQEEEINEVVDEIPSSVDHDESEETAEKIDTRKITDIDSDSSEDRESEEESDEDNEDVQSGLVPEASSNFRALRDRTSKVKPVKYSHLTTDPTR
ncbi:hypothetical protein PGT21_012849 [Puccinia graminis f. sp. tritici]|uniref:Uncharacterized protein n=1 Tax=Puccinia graminis f. sp. tritici TaxID=56615 RepID=A0A5B0N590_PUCGR|nr:hypothetical protein PGTUg99_027586 [Puccinia graminis f. sp. tritici]KAA1094197.1 hypothetical protein PGT21_012849 [Puccinia graminis f. sp. tritici]